MTVHRLTDRIAVSDAPSEDELRTAAREGYRTIIDLRAGFELPDEKLRISAFARNVGNVYYWTNVQDNLASVTRFAGMPRTYGLQASWRY